MSKTTTTTTTAQPNQWEAILADSSKSTEEKLSAFQALRNERLLAEAKRREERDAKPYQPREHLFKEKAANDAAAALGPEVFKALCQEWRTVAETRDWSKAPLISLAYVDGQTVDIFGRVSKPRFAFLADVAKRSVEGRYQAINYEQVILKGGTFAEWLGALGDRARALGIWAPKERKAKARLVKQTDGPNA
jgi:hypothetical protein